MLEMLLPKIPDRFHTLDVGSETRRGETPCGCGCQGFCYSYLGDFRETFWGFLFFFQGILLKLQPFRVVFFFGGGYWLQKFPLVHMLEILSYWVILGMLPGILDVMNDSIWFLLVPDVDLEIQLMFSSSREAKWVSDHRLMTNGILEILQTSA